MPRFTPWHPDATPDHDAHLLREVVVRPSPEKAIPLPSDDYPGEERFRQLLDALSQQSGPDGKAGLPAGRLIVPAVGSRDEAISGHPSRRGRRS